MGFPGGSEVKEFACKAGDLGSIPRLGRSPGQIGFVVFILYHLTWAFKTLTQCPWNISSNGTFGKNPARTLLLHIPLAKTDLALWCLTLLWQLLISLNNKLQRAIGIRVVLSHWPSSPWYVNLVNSYWLTHVSHMSFFLAISTYDLPFYSILKYL